MYTLLSEQKMPEGSWKCEKCNNINYPFRTKCNRQNCGADKPSEPKKSPSPTPDENDQVCCVVYFCIYISFVKLLIFPVRYVHITIFNIIFLELFLMDQLQRLLFSILLVLFLCRGFLLRAFNLFFSPHSVAYFNLKLSTVPVSTRTYLRVEKVQSCHPALLNMGVWKSVLSSSCCSGCQVTLPSRDCVKLLY